MERRLVRNVERREGDIKQLELIQKRVYEIGIFDLLGVSAVSRFAWPDFRTTIGIEWLLQVLWEHVVQVIGSGVRCSWAGGNHRWPVPPH